MAVKWGLEGELVCKPDRASPAQPPPSLLTWDLLLHADTVLLPVALSTDTAVAPVRVLTLLVLSWTNHCFTLIHIWGRRERGHSADCPEFPHSTPDCISLPRRLNVASLLPLPLPPFSPHWHKTHLGTWSPPAGSHGYIFCSALALLPYNPGRPLHNLERAEGRGGEEKQR